MKNLHLATILFTASLMLALPAATQAASQAALSAPSAASHSVQATIPFEFRAGSSVLPAGTYLFTFDPISQSGSIQGVGRQIKVVGLAHYVPSSPESKLQFKRDGKLMVLQSTDAVSYRAMNRRTGVAALQSAATAAGR